MRDFGELSQHADSFRDVDVAFFCIGVYTGQVSDQVLKKITVDYAVAFAETLKANSPGASLCFLSGASARSGGKEPDGVRKVQGRR